MRQLIVNQLDYDLTSVTGLALVGHYPKVVQLVLARLDAALLVMSGVAKIDIVRSYVGLLFQGKSDLDAIENLRDDEFCKQALGIALLLASPALRQRGRHVRLYRAYDREPAGWSMPRLKRQSCSTCAARINTSFEGAWSVARTPRIDFNIAQFLGVFARLT